MKFLKILLFCLLATPLWSQYSPKTQWLKIETDHFNIIYDENVKEDIIKVANDLENYYISISGEFNSHIDRYTIVFPSLMTDTNGYVSSINNKSVFYPLPPIEPFAGSVEWYKLLTLHETRHMAQYSFVRDSFAQKILEFLFGSYGIIGATFMPSYMYEGDAVLTETLLSDSGRGRSPSFERELRTELLTNKNYSFSKVLLSSEKDPTPNQYVFGYYLMTYLKKEFGPDILPVILNKAANNSLPLNFSAATLFTTGKSIPTIYKDVQDELFTKWSEQDNKIIPTKTEVIQTSKNSSYTNNIMPTIKDKDTTLYIEKAYNSYGSLIELNGDKKIIHTSVSGKYSLFENNILYASDSIDARWDYTGYSDLYIYNLKSKKSIKVTKNQRYFIPEFSPKGDRVALLEYSETRIPSIIILDSKTYKIVSSIPFKNGEMVNSIKWDNDGENLIITKMDNIGSSVGLLNIKESTYMNLSETNNIIKSNAIGYKDYILFISTYSGVENINAININTKEEFQVISSRFGVNYPTVYENKLYFSQYTESGYQLEYISLDPNSWTPISEVSQDHVDYFEPLLGSVIPPTNNYIEYKSEVYNPNKNLIDIHSWLYNPFVPSEIKSEVIDVDRDSPFDVHELVLFSSDYLEKMDSVFYSHYNIKLNSFDIGTYGSYNNFYPKIYWDFNLFSENIESFISTLNLSLTLEVPLSNIYNNRYNYLGIGVTPAFYLDNRTSESGIFALSYYLNHYINIREFSLQNILGLNHGVNYDQGVTISLDTTITLPGFFKNNGFSINNSALWSSRDNVTPYSILDINYTIPIFYPDLSIFNWIYLKSIDLDLGSNTTFILDNNFTEKLGATISAGYYLLRMPIEFLTSFEYYYDFQESKFKYDIIPISFNLVL